MYTCIGDEIKLEQIARARCIRSFKHIQNGQIFWTALHERQLLYFRHYWVCNGYGSDLY